jgi:hypothetical protein
MCFKLVKIYKVLNQVKYNPKIYRILFQIAKLNQSKIKTSHTTENMYVCMTELGK